MRCLISVAAFSVNVMARMRCGETFALGDKPRETFDKNAGFAGARTRDDTDVLIKAMGSGDLFFAEAHESTGTPMTAAAATFSTRQMRA